MADISKIILPNGSSYDLKVYKVNNHTVESDVPSNAQFTDTNTTYTLSISNNRITLTPSSGTASYVDLPVYNGGVSSS